MTISYKARILFSILTVFFLFSCGSKKLVLQKHGVSYEGKEEIVVSYQDLRKMYDNQSFLEIFNVLEPVKDMEVTDYFIHFLLIQSAVSLSRQGDLEKSYLNSGNRYFYFGMLAYEERKYQDAASYFKLMKSKDPVIDYLIGSALLFYGDRTESLGYLLLARRWQAPWPYLALASYAEMGKDFASALEFLTSAENATYEFEKNIITDTQIKKGEILLLQQKYEEALFYAKQVYDRDKEKSLSLLDPGEVLLAWGKASEAADFWQKAVEDVQVSQEMKKLLQRKLEILKSIEG